MPGPDTTLQSSPWALAGVAVNGTRTMVETVASAAVNDNRARRRQRAGMDDLLVTGASRGEGRCGLGMTT